MYLNSLKVISFIVILKGDQWKQLIAKYKKGDVVLGHIMYIDIRIGAVVHFNLDNKFIGVIPFTAQQHQMMEKFPIPFLASSNGKTYTINQLLSKDFLKQNKQVKCVIETFDEKQKIVYLYLTWPQNIP